MLIEIIIIFLLTIFYTVTTFIIVGILIELLHKLVAYLLGGHTNYKAIIATSIIGTPIHELGHAFFSVIFGHKITDMKLVVLKPTDGTLGYVNHSYNKKNIYHRIGNLFIGIGPIISCSIAVWIIILLFSNELKLPTGISINSFYDLTNNFILIFKEIFNFEKHFILITLQTFLIMSISIHARLSFSDIKGSFDGLLFYSLFVLVVVLILYFILPNQITTFMNAITLYFTYSLNIFVVIIFGALLYVGVALIWFLVRKLLLRR